MLRRPATLLAAVLLTATATAAVATPAAATPAAATAAVATPAAGAPTPAVAADDPYCTASWTGGTGAWSDPAGWSTGSVPTATDFVCVLGTAGAPAPVVTVGGTVTVEAVTVVDGTLRLADAATTLTLDDLVVTRGTVVGRGTVRPTTWGAVRLDTARLGAVRVITEGSVYLARTVTMTGGARLEQTPFAAAVTLVRDVQVRDGDGHPGNGVVVTDELTVAEGRTLSVEVPLRLADGRADVGGLLRLPRLVGLDADGVLQAPDDHAVRLRTTGAGRVELPRSLTAVGRGVVVEGTVALVTPTGADALADLRSIAGTVSTWRTLTLSAPVEVTGRLGSLEPLETGPLTVRGTGAVVVSTGAAPALRAPSVDVGPRATFDVRSVTGTVTSSGTASIAGGSYGAVRWGATASTTAALAYPASVAGPARLAGALRVLLPPARQLPADGARVVVLTAAGGLTGRFTAVTTSPPARGRVTLEYTPTQVVAVYRAPT